MRIPSLMETPTNLNPWVANSLRGCAAGWSVGALETNIEPDVVANQVFGFQVLSAADFGSNPDISSAYLVTSSYLELLDVPILLLLSTTAFLNTESTRRLLMGTSLKHLAGLIVFGWGLAHGYDGGPLLGPTYLALEVLTVLALLARSQELVDNNPQFSFQSLALKAKDDFLGAVDARKFSSVGPLEGFFRLGFFSALFVGASFALSPVSPIAPSDMGETMVSRVLRGQYGLSLAFLLTPISVLQAEAAATGTLEATASRLLNLGYSALTAASGYLTLTGRSDQIERQDVLSLDSVDRWSTNTQAAGSLAAILALFYLSQAVVPYATKVEKEP